MWAGAPCVDPLGRARLSIIGHSAATRSAEPRTAAVAPPMPLAPRNPASHAHVAPVLAGRCPATWRRWWRGRAIGGPRARTACSAHRVELHARDSGLALESGDEPGFAIAPRQPDGEGQLPQRCGALEVPALDGR